MTDPAFAPFTFPSLPGASPEDRRESIRGHAAGYAAGRKRIETELETLRESMLTENEQRAQQDRAELQLALDALARAAAEFRTHQLPTLQSVDASIAAAAFELAEAIVGRELAAGEGSPRAAIERAVLEAGPSTSAVRLNPADLAVIVADGGTQPGVDFVPDADLARGDAIVDLADGSLDARVSTSLARVKAALVAGTA